MDVDYLKKKNIQMIPSAMTYSEDEKCFKSDGTRVVYLNANAAVKPGETGIGFLFAPLHHGPMRYVAVIREDMGIRTIFNLIGPLANPAAAAAYMLGVYDPSLTEKMVQVLIRLGAKDAFVVCGEGTFDEISVCGPTRISRLINDQVETHVIEPEEYGFRRADRDEIQGTGPRIWNQDPRAQFGVRIA